MTAIEALENWYNTESPATKAYEYELHYRIIKKELKALKIIKRKDICPTKLYGAKDYKTYLWVCEQEQIDKEWILTEKEYNLLNEVFFE